MIGFPRVFLFSPRGLTFLALVLGLLPLGCGIRFKKPVYSVRGKILYQGEPLADAEFLLTPVGGIQPDVPRPHAVTREDGSFEVGTYALGDGAPAGDYIVSVIWQGKRSGAFTMDPRPNLLDKRFSDPARSEWLIRIEPKPNELEPIDLR
jgi:hypothetical protein